MLGLSGVAYDRALQLAGLVPGRRDWMRYINRFLVTHGIIGVRGSRLGEGSRRHGAISAGASQSKFDRQAHRLWRLARAGD